MKYDRLLDEMGFPGPVTPQVPQDRIRQTYRGLPGAGLGCASCRLPPDSLGALPAGAFAGAIAMLAGTRRRNSPGTMSPEIAISAGLAKGGHHGGGHHGGGHHHHGGGRGGSWWGYPGGYDRGDTYYIETGPQCPVGWAWDPVGLKCVKIPTVVLRGLGTTASDWCTALRTGSAAASAFSSLCDSLTDATQKAVCQAAFRAAAAGVSTGCAHVDDPSGGTLPPVSLVKQGAAFAAALNTGASASSTFVPATPDVATPKAFTDTPTGKAVVYGGAALGAAALLILLLRR